MRKNVNAKIFSRMSGDDAMLFYLKWGEEWFPLFRTYHSWPIFREYENGKPIDYLFRNSRRFRQQKIRARLLQHVEDIEKEHHIQILKKTKNHSKRSSKTCDAVEDYYRTV